MERHPCVYIVTNKPNGTLYVGVTSNLPQRVWQHKNKVVQGFSKQYQLNSLVWYEMHLTMTTAIQREKQIKAWYRKWKLDLIESSNPDWSDLYEEIV